MDDAVVTLLRRTLDATADEIDEIDLGNVWIPDRQSGRSFRWRALTLVACAALMAAGVVVVGSRGGGLTEMGRGSDTVVPAQQPDWYLPSYLPEGYEVGGLGSTTDVSDETTSNEVWVRKDGGRTTGHISAWVNTPGPASGIWTSPGGRPYVHGIPATGRRQMYTNDPASDDVVYSIEWTERDVRFEITVYGISYDEMVQIAEASTIDGDVLTLVADTMPPDFELVERAEYPTGASYTVENVVVAPIEIGTDAVIYTSIRTRQSPLDALVVREDERRVIDDVEYSVASKGPPYPAEEFGHHEITWVRDGHLFETSGRVDPEVLLEYAAGFARGSERDAASAIDTISASREAFPEFDRVTLAGGTVVVARTRDESVGVEVLCLSAAESACYRDYLGAFASNVPAPSPIFTVFALAGGREVVGWQQEHPAAVAAGGPSFEVTKGRRGWFITAFVPDGDPLPDEVGAGWHPTLLEPDRYWP